MFVLGLYKRLILLFYYYLCLFVLKSVASEKRTFAIDPEGLEEYDQLRLQRMHLPGLESDIYFRLVPLVQSLSSTAADVPCNGVQADEHCVLSLFFSLGIT